MASWGEVAPEELDRLLEHGCREVPRAMLNALSHRWRQLQAENAPLRAVVNGQLHSVPVDFYDGMLLSRLPEAGQTLRLAELIGRTLAECRPGIGDWWLAGGQRRWPHRENSAWTGIPTAFTTAK